MSTGLMSLNQNTDIAVQSEEEAALKALMSSGNYLPRLQFFSNASDAVKSGRVTMNVYGLSRGKDDVEELGKEIEVVPFAVRSKALDLRGGEVLSYYKFSTPQFQTVLELSKIQDSKCMAGTEFLIWVPSVQEFCTFFAYNVSSKQEAPKIKALINKAMTMKSKYVPRPKNSFQAIVCIESSVVPEALPSQEDLDKVIEKFKNPSDSTASAVTTTEAQATSRAQ